MLNEFFSSRLTIGVPVDAGGDRVVVNESAKTLGVGPRSDFLLFVGLTGGVIVVLTKVVIDVITGRMIGVGVGVFAEFDSVAAFGQVIALEVFVTASCVEDMRWTGTGIKIDIIFVTWVGTVVGVLIGLSADTSIGFVTDIGVDLLTDVNTNVVEAVVTDLEFIDTWVSLADVMGCFC